MIPARTPATVRLAVSTGLVMLAVLTSMLGLRTIVLPPWPAVGVGGVLLVGAAIAATRAAIGGRRARVAAAARAGAQIGRVPRDDGGTSSSVPTLVGTLVAAWYLLARFGGVGGTTQWLPDAGSFSRLGDLLGAAGEIIRGEVAPVVATAPVALLCVGGALGVLLAADALASGLRHPLLAAAAVLVLWLPQLVLTGGVPRVTFAVTAATLLLGLALDAPPATRRTHDLRVGAQVRQAEWRRAARTTVTAAGVTALALAASAAAGGTTGSGGSWTSLFTTTARSVRLADDLDMARSLSTRSTAEVLSYRTSTGSTVGPLRLLTLSSFDGRHWTGGPDVDGVEFEPGDLLFPQETRPAEEPTRVDVTVGTMREDRLPLSIEPRAVTADGGWRYDADRDEVVGGPTTHDGDTFTLDVHPRSLTADALRDAPAGADVVSDEFLSVPTTSHEADIARTAREIVGDAATDYDRAVALQSYLRDATRFTYDVEVPRGETGDPVWDFLQQRQGFCVQFATTMVTLARTLGIPARLGVGYLPGTPVDGGVRWTVTGEDSHAWPELYFPGSGWVRFEPTPAIQAGAVPSYADPSSVGASPAPTPTADERTAPTTAATAQAPAPGTSPATPRAQEQVVEGTSSSRGWLVGAGLALTAGAAIVVLWLRRRSVRPPLDAESAWVRVVTALAGAGITLPTATTPRQAPQEVARAWAARTGEAIPDPVQDALTSLAGALEAERYAAQVDPLGKDRLAQLTRDVTAGVAAVGRSRVGAGR
ncbi:transglutaminase domain-containing protein [Xylanimonas allomyrinae]|uniref:Transglutaminase domain-containing protein n=1 Tax=Xylanimonas allomyrinae TaxID=2509459 RepID=A0A4V0YDY5_9MICO|nr:transglutaminase domain-containing protein [Xylanimonas allomyrinae]QAY62331.1 transglutaminase domain-containing protein [Xylanimonas allomyrinae]